MKRFIKTSLAFTTLLVCLSFVSIYKNDANQTIKEVYASNKTIEDDLFVEVNNFLYSNKGFLMEFEYDLPSETKTIEFCFMDFTNDWHRLTDYFKMTFNKDGTIVTPVGRILKVKEKYYFELMFNTLEKYLNKGEGAFGNETLNGMYIKEDSVGFTPIKTDLITTTMKAYPVSEVRNDKIPGLTFEAFVPELIKDAEYKMMIVPSSYLKDADGDYKHYFEENKLPFIDLECNPTYLSSSDPVYKSFGSGYSFKASIINIKEDNYQVPFVAIPYYIDGGYITYSNFIRETKVTYYDKCLEFKKSANYNEAKTETKKEVENVIYKCEHHATKLNIGNRIKAHFPLNTEKLFKNASLPETLVTENIMYSAKNESERGQLVISVPDNFNKNYFVSIEPFINSSDSSKLISPKNVKIEQQLYQNVETNWSVGSSQQKKYYPDSKPIYDLPLGYVPDALLPFDIALDSNENILTSSNGNLNAISYTVSVPKDAVSGEYKSKIVIRISGEGTLALPITLNVFDFELPNETKAKDIIIVNTGETGALYGTGAKDITSSYNLAAYKFLEERNISGGQIPETCWSIDDLSNYVKVAKDYALNDKIGSYFLPNPSERIKVDVRVKTGTYNYKTVTLNDLLVYRAVDTYYDENILLPGMKTILRELIKASTNEADLLKKAVCYFPQADEPGKNEDKQLQNVLCQNVLLRCIDELLEENLFVGKEKVKQSLKKVAYLVTSYPRAYLNGSSYLNLDSITPHQGYEDVCSICYCDSLSAVKYTTMKGYCPTYDSFQWDITDVKNNGFYDLMNYVDNPSYTIWWYGCIQPITPYPCMFVNANLIQKRVNKWTQFKFGVEGELYYMSNRTQKYENSVSYPLIEAEILNGKATYEGTYGDGNLIYPVHKMYGKYDSKLYYLSSLRIDNIAESIDDYNYISYAYEMIKNLENPGDFEEELSNLLSSVNNGPGRNTTDHEFFNEQRIKLGNLIAELSKK